MDHFHLRDGELYAEDVPLARIADEVGTPVYVYSRATLERHARVFRDALAGLPRKHVAFAVKANPNLAVLRVMQREGFGADVVSGGELARALAAGMAADDIVFSGVGKTARELAQGLNAGIGQFNIESEEEGAELSEIAAARGLRGEELFLPLADCRLYAPLRPGKQIALAGNYREAAAGGAPAGGPPRAGLGCGDVSDLARPRQHRRSDSAAR